MTHETTASHRDAEPRLQAYLDGELSDREAAALREHLEACAECRRTLEDLRALQTTLNADLAPALEHSMWPRIEARLAPVRPWWDPMIGFATAGAAIAGIVIGMLLGSGRTTDAAANEDLWSALGATIATDRGVAIADFAPAEASETR